jgi:hypothetical protein
MPYLIDGLLRQIVSAPRGAAARGGGPFQEGWLLQETLFARSGAAKANTCKGDAGYDVRSRANWLMGRCASAASRSGASGRFAICRRAIGLQHAKGIAELRVASGMAKPSSIDDELPTAAGSRTLDR